MAVWICPKCGLPNLPSHAICYHCSQLPEHRVTTLRRGNWDKALWRKITLGTLLGLIVVTGALIWSKSGTTAVKSGTTPTAEEAQPLYSGRMQPEILPATAQAASTSPNLSPAITKSYENWSTNRGATQTTAASSDTNSQGGQLGEPATDNQQSQSTPTPTTDVTAAARTQLQGAWDMIPSTVDRWIAMYFNPGTRPAIREGMEEDVKYGHYETARVKALAIIRIIRDRASKQLKTRAFERGIDAAMNGCGPGSPGPDEQTLTSDVLQLSQLIDDLGRLPVPE